MEIIEKLRRTAVLAAENAKHKRQAMQTASQKRGEGHEADFFANPVDIRGWKPLQDLTPGSPTLGQFLF